MGTGRKPLCFQPPGAGEDRAGPGSAGCLLKRSVGNGPASSYRLSGARGTIGFIDAVSNHFCDRCNRLRLTADGKLRPCLHDQREVELLQALRSGASDAELQDLFRAALLLKPANYHEATGAPANGRGMCQIGG